MSDEQKAPDWVQPLQEIFKPIHEARSTNFNAAFARLKANFGIDCRLYTSACPVQVHITCADGTLIYFRERWGEWSIERVAAFGFPNSVEALIAEGEISSDEVDSWSSGDEFERIIRPIIEGTTP